MYTILDNVDLSLIFLMLLCRPTIHYCHLLMASLWLSTRYVHIIIKGIFVTLV